MLTLGTGIGGGIITNGHLYRGASGAAGELGHMMIEYDGPRCQGACPNHGCLEVVRLGTGHGPGGARRRSHSSPTRPSARRWLRARRSTGRCSAVSRLSGDAAAVAVLADIGEKLGLGITSLVNIFNPELVVIGGGAAQAGEIILGPARRVVAERALLPQRDEVRIVPARHGVDAGVLGAAALAIIELFPDEAPVAPLARVARTTRRPAVPAGADASLPCARPVGILVAADPSWATARRGGARQEVTTSQWRTESLTTVSLARPA